MIENVSGPNHVDGVARREAGPTFSTQEGPSPNDQTARVLSGHRLRTHCMIMQKIFLLGRVGMKVNPEPSKAEPFFRRSNVAWESGGVEAVYLVSNPPVV